MESNLRALFLKGNFERDLFLKGKFQGNLFYKQTSKHFWGEITQSFIFEGKNRGMQMARIIGEVFITFTKICRFLFF